MIPRPAQYLLRFDDLCPTFSRKTWERFQGLIDEFRIQPILAVIPDNRDLEFSTDSPDPEFWSKMFQLQQEGATIGLHGYQHLCESEHPGILRLHRKNEFPGIPEAQQQEWMRMGLQILRSHKLDPKIFVAPRHGFDRATLQAMKAEGIEYLSDGFARVPFTRHGVRWVPQQLWAPVEKKAGLWTICIHIKSSGDWLPQRLRSFLELHVAQFTSFDRVVKEYAFGHLNPRERLHEFFALNRTRLARYRKRSVRDRRLGRA